MGTATSVPSNDYYQFFHKATNFKWTPVVVSDCEGEPDLVTVQWLDSRTSSFRRQLLSARVLKDRRVFILPSRDQEQSDIFDQIECAAWLSNNDFGDLIPSIRHAGYLSCHKLGKVVSGEEFRRIGITVDSVLRKFILLQPTIPVYRNVHCQLTTKSIFKPGHRDVSDFVNHSVRGAIDAVHNGSIRLKPFSEAIYVYSLKRSEFCGHKAFYRIILITPKKRKRPRPLLPGRAKTAGRDAHRRQQPVPPRRAGSSSVSAAAATTLPSGQGTSDDLCSPMQSPVFLGHDHAPRLASAELVPATQHSSGHNQRQNKPSNASVHVVAEATLVDPFTSDSTHAEHSQHPQPQPANAQNGRAGPSSSAPPVAGRRYSFAEGRRNSFILQERAELAHVLYCAAHAQSEEDFEALSPKPGNDDDGAGDAVGENKTIGIEDVIDVRSDEGRWQMGIVKDLRRDKKGTQLCQVEKPETGELEWVEMVPSRISVFGSRFDDSQHTYFVGKFVSVYVDADAPSGHQRDSWHIAQVVDMTATQVKVHMDGWSRAYDRWIDVSLPTHREIIREIGGEAQESPNDIIAQRKAEDLKFRKILEEQCHFKVIEMDKDGNCLFRCVAEALYGSCERHLEIREQTCDYIQSHVAQFLDFVSNDFDEYLAKMRKPMEWGGDIEVIAMQEVFGVRIVIYSSSAPNPAIPIPGISLNDHITDKGTITMSYHGRNHYNLLKQVSPSVKGQRQSAYDEEDASDGKAGVAVSSAPSVTAEVAQENVEQADRNTSPANDDPDDDDSLSVGEPPENLRLESCEGLSPGSISVGSAVTSGANTPAEALLPMLEEPAGGVQVDAVRVNQAVKMSSVNHALLESGGRKALTPAGARARRGSRFAPRVQPKPPTRTSDETASGDKGKQREGKQVHAQEGKRQRPVSQEEGDNEVDADSKHGAENLKSKN